jgi:fructose-1,6-bisphosphatase I
MDADVRRIMSSGVNIMSPRAARGPDKPGKLRWMYRGNPMEFLTEMAGGAATNGHQRILDMRPTKLHERAAVFPGPKNGVDRATVDRGSPD